MHGDLISRSALMERLKEEARTGTIGSDYNMFEYLINEQPTAYSVEKVIEQAHKIFVDELEIIEKGIPEGGEYTEEAYRLLYLNKCVSDAVRNGGKE